MGILLVASGSLARIRGSVVSFAPKRAAVLTSGWETLTKP
jgi:hypothetical protein